MSSNSIPPVEFLLQKELSYPDFAKLNHDEGTVLVNFCIDQNGKIQVQQVNSDNDALRDYVVQKITTLKFTNPEEANREFNMKFVFRLL